MAVVVSVWFLLACCIGGGIGVAREALRRARFSWESLIAWLTLSALCALAFYLRLRVLPLHHIMYVDEPWYEEAARNVLRKGALLLCEQARTGEVCQPYPKSAGWPSLLVIAFAVGGVGEDTALRTTALLGALAVPAIAVLTRLAGGRWFHAALAASLLTFHPIHLTWSMTAETNVSSVTFLLLGLAGVLALSQTGSWAAVLLAAGGLGVAAAIRPELWLAFVPAFATILVRRSAARIPWRKIGVLAFGAVLGGLPGMLSRDAFLVHSGGPILQTSYLVANVRAWWGSPSDGGTLSAVVFAAGALGAIVCAVRGRGDASAVLAVTTLLVGGFVLLYYPPSGFYARTMLGALAPGAVLAALVIPSRPGVFSWAGAALALALSAATAHGSWLLRDSFLNVRMTQRWETVLPDATGMVKLPAEAVVLAEWPTILTATTELKVMPTGKALSDGIDALAEEASHRPVYLLCDMFCEKHFGGADAPSACQRIAERFKSEQLVSVGGPDRNYGLFRLKGLAAPGEPGIPCP
jgi:hypothetical protein